jgi:hypothetical protein
LPEGEFDYRAMERIHAKAAFRAMQRALTIASDIDPGLFYFRLGVVASLSGDDSVAEYYLRQALSIFSTVKSSRRKIK